jgi:hypothetical protein
MGNSARKEMQFDPQHFSDIITVILLIITRLSTVQRMQVCFNRKEIEMFTEMQVLGGLHLGTWKLTGAPDLVSILAADYYAQISY